MTIPDSVAKLTGERIDEESIDLSGYPPFKVNETRQQLMKRLGFADILRCQLKQRKLKGENNA